jgi:coenzyme Q-binding protein COQ10
MGQANTSGIFKAPIAKVFKVITDYGSYPQFMSDVKRVSVIEAGPDKKLVEYELQIIKTFRYQLWMFEKAPTDVSWKFHTGEMFKENSGSWKLTDLGDGTTKAEYSLTAKFGVFVPGMIEKKLIEVNLPTMMKSFTQRIESL